MTLAARILFALGLASLCFGAGWATHSRITAGQKAKEQLQASEQARRVERDNAVSVIRRMDSYSVTQARNEALARGARADLEGVRHSIAAIAAAPASAASCGPDPRLPGLLELLAEGASLVEEGPRHLEELRAKRDALKE